MRLPLNGSLAWPLSISRLRERVRTDVQGAALNFADSVLSHLGIQFTCVGAERGLFVIGRVPRISFRGRCFCGQADC